MRCGMSKKVCDPLYKQKKSGKEEKQRESGACSRYFQYPVEKHPGAEKGGGESAENAQGKEAGNGEGSVGNADFRKGSFR